MTIDNLPDIALLETFDFYMVQNHIEAWHTLVHVCRKWRNVIFGSPRRLGLRLQCKARTPVRETLDVWPPLPIVIWVPYDEKWGDDNIYAALGHNDRICSFDVSLVPRSQAENVWEALQQPFPALETLRLAFEDTGLPILSDSFLGGSAPSLETLMLDRIPFPGLPKILLSATHLVILELWNIPPSGYFSPEVIVTCFFVLTRLKRIAIQFEALPIYPDRGGPPPQTRTILPVLGSLRFLGPSEYLEDLLARIDVPLLSELWIIFFHQLIFDTPQLNQFISRTPNFDAHDKADVQFINRRGVCEPLPLPWMGS